MRKHGVYLDLGAAGIRLTFSCPHFVMQAQQHVFLSEDFHGQTVGIIDYIEDDSVSQLIRVPCNPNAVHISKDDLGGGHQKIVLRMFDKFTIALDVQKNRVAVRYPSDVPVRLMLDDVLQAALQPILDALGGFILHGSCVVRGKTAIVFMGKSGSGKSTTAFNLTRFGFHCYADDAVLITPADGALWAWPLAREFSIRPLSFRLFHEQGVQINDYKKDGEKYYFSQVTEKYRGARLKHICFVEVNGEPETVISYLDPEQTLQILLQEDRHFSFMERESAPVYSKILAEKVPMLLSARVGTDLDAQAQAFEEFILGHVSPSGKKCSAISFQASRKQKMALIRQAWSNPGREPLKELIPLLGDFDLKVFTLALGFFQTYPPAHIEPIEPPSYSDIVPQKFEASWLRAMNWVEGCQKLLCHSGVEVFQRFALAWIKSAPLIYPFLKALTYQDPEKSKQVEEAWNRYKGENAKSGSNERKRVEIHLVNFQDVSAWLHATFHDWWSSLLSYQSEISHVYFWITQTELLDQKAMRPLLKTIGKVPLLTVVPVGLKNGDSFTMGIEFARFALECGLKPKISRFTPLCRIGDEDAHFLLDTGALERTTEEGQTKRLLFAESLGDGRVLNSIDSIREVRWPDSNVLWLEKPYPACESCGLYSLGLCRGGFLSNVE